MSYSVEQSRQLLRRIGLRCTTSRVAVLQFLSAVRRPMTHAEVAADLVPRGFDKSTIYRSLVEMSEAGIASRIDVGDHSWRFELKDGDPGRATEHPHFMCLDCGKVTCLPEAPQRANDGWTAPGEVTEVLLKGHCEDCT